LIIALFDNRFFCASWTYFLEAAKNADYCNAVLDADSV